MPVPHVGRRLPVAKMVMNFFRLPPMTVPIIIYVGLLSANHSAINPQFALLFSTIFAQS